MDSRAAKLSYPFLDNTLMLFATILLLLAGLLLTLFALTVLVMPLWLLMQTEEIYKAIKRWIKVLTKK